MGRYDQAKNCVEEMHQNRCSQQRGRLHTRRDEKQSGEVAEGMIKIHRRT